MYFSFVYGLGLWLAYYLLAYCLLIYLFTYLLIYDEPISFFMPAHLLTTNIFKLTYYLPTYLPTHLLSCALSCALYVDVFCRVSYVLEQELGASVM